MKINANTLYQWVYTFFILSLTAHFAIGQAMVEKKNGGEKQASYLFASGGVSIPQENGLPDVNASGGPQLTVGYNTFFTKRWGMGLVLSGSVYKSEVVNRYSSYSGANYFSSTPTQNWQKAESYITFSYTPILKKHWAIDIIQGYGLYYIKKPAYDYWYNGMLQSHEASKKGWNTAYNIGLVGRVMLRDHVGLFVKANFFYETGILPNKGSAYAFNSVDCELGVVVNLKK